MHIPNRLHIKQTNPHVHDILQRVAATAFEHAVPNIPVSLLDTVDIQLAVADGFLTLTNDDVAFADIDLQLDYTARYAASQLSTVWNDIAVFTEAFSALKNQGVMFGTYREFGAAVLIILANEDQHDILEGMAQIAQVEIARRELSSTPRNHAFWNYYTSFCMSLPVMNIDAHDLAVKSTYMLQAVAGDLSKGLLYDALERYAAQSYNNANILYQALVMVHTDTRLLVHSLCGLGMINIHEAHRRALDLLNSSISELHKAGILSLGRLNYSSEAAKKMLISTLSRLDALQSISNNADSIVLAQAYSDLLAYAPTVSSAIEQIAKCSDPEVKHAVAWVLSRHCDKAEHHGWIKNALSQLVGVPSENKGTFQYLDQCAHRLASTDPEGVLAFIETVIVNRPYNGRAADNKITTMLEMTCNTLYREHESTLCHAITRWFASRDRRLHRAARHVIENSGILDRKNRAAPLRLSKPVVDSLDEEQVCYMLMRILGHSVFGHQSAALMLSALQREPCSVELQQFVNDLLYDYVLYNNPGDAGQYLRDRVKAHDVTDIEKSVAQSALDRTYARQEARRALPPLKELQASSQHIYLARLAKQKQQTAIMEQVEKRSALLSLVHHAPLKYGRSFFFEREGTFSEPTLLQTVEHSIEVPLGELTNPVGQTYQRLIWQSVGLDQLNEGELGEDELTNQGS